MFDKKKRLKLDKYNLKDGASLIKQAATDLSGRDRSLMKTLFSNVGFGNIRAMD